MGDRWVTVWTPGGFRAVTEEEVERYGLSTPGRAEAQELAELRQMVDLQGRQIEQLTMLTRTLRVALTLHLSGGSMLLEEARQQAHDLKRLPDSG